MLIKPVIFLVLGLISSYICETYIFESDQFDQYMDYMLKDFENPSAAMIGLFPKFIVFVNLVVCIVVHLFTILLFKLLKSSSIPSVVKQLFLIVSIFLFLGFCTITVINLVNVYEGYLIPTLIPKIFWIGYGSILLFTFFKSQRDLFNFLREVNEV